MTKKQEFTVAQARLKSLYMHAPDVVKRRAWEVFGKTDKYFRVVIGGKHNPSIDTILSAIQALKQAYSDCKVEYKESYDRGQKAVDDIEVEFQEIKANQD